MQWTVNLQRATGCLPGCFGLTFPGTDASVKEDILPPFPMEKAA